jgi:alpha-tubulin suppressor-like RCC1 family protein
VISSKGVNTPTQLPILTNIKKIATGHSHTIAITDNGGIFSFGFNLVNIKYNYSMVN